MFDLQFVVDEEQSTKFQQVSRATCDGVTYTIIEYLDGDGGGTNLIVTGGRFSYDHVSEAKTAATLAARALSLGLGLD